ncbi:MAG: putative peptidoglycan-binding domain-containing protein [Gammaproteobacteria bacterium]
MREIDRVIELEGGGEFTDDPFDKGGPTRFGITEAVAREDGYQGPMRELPRARAVAIYFEQYVTGPKFDRIYAVSPELGVLLIQAGVLIGQPQVSILLQRLLNALNRQEELYPDVIVDGNLGPQSRGALRAFVEARGEEGLSVLSKGLWHMVGAYLIGVAEHDETQERFLYGWLRARS